MAPLESPLLRVVTQIGSLEILDALPQAMTLADLDGRIEWCNRAAAMLRGDPNETVLGHRLVEISQPEDETAWEAISEQIRAGETVLSEVLVARAGSDRVPVRVSRSPLRDRSGSVVGILSVAADLSEELRARKALVESEQRLGSLFTFSNDVAVVLSHSGRILFVSASVERVAGWRADQLVGTSGWDLLHPEDRSVAITEIAANLAAGRPVTHEWRVMRADGSYGWFEHTLADFSHVPAIGGVVGNLSDVTERHEADQARRESELVLRRVIEVTSTAFVGLDREGLITEWNRAAEELFGWPASDAVGAEITTLIVPERRRRVFRRLFTHFTEGRGGLFLRRPFEMEAKSRSGRSFPIEVTVMQVRVGDRTHYRAFVRDISERKAVESRLAEQALTDSLTGLPNRTLLKDRLGRALGRLGRHPGVVAVMFLDLDRFKYVNDALGHEAGDELLVEVGERLRLAVRDNDTIARYGGDEFVVVAEDAGDQEAVGALAERLLSSIAEPVRLKGTELRPTVSVGIAITTGDKARPDDLIRDADIAMYRAKERGGNCAEAFESMMESRSIVRFELERDLRRAVEARPATPAGRPAFDELGPGGRLRLYYQPVVDFCGRIAGVEALVRWEHPVYGLLSPVDFIPLAEETGLVVPLGQLVLAEAVRQVALWRATIAPELTVSVNVSARQLDHDNLPRLVAAILADTGLDPAALCLEMTESALLRDTEAAIAILEELRGLGVQVAIDDFGTGYSSLIYLRSFPVQVVKLDRTFVSGVTTSAEDAAIVSAVVELTHALGLVSVAEGVETAAQRDALARLGCDLGQGYLWSAPRPAAELAPFLSASAVPERAATG